MSKRKSEPYVKRPRIDGVGKLTPAEKAERDARTQHGMKVMAMSTVYEAAKRSGWYNINEDGVLAAMRAGQVTCDDTHSYINADDGVYRIERVHHDEAGTWFDLRKVKSL